MAEVASQSPRDPRWPTLPEKHWKAIREAIDHGVQADRGRRARMDELEAVERDLAEALAVYREHLNDGRSATYPLEHVRAEIELVREHAEALRRAVSGLSEPARELLGFGSDMHAAFSPEGGTAVPGALLAKWCDRPEGPPPPTPALFHAEDQVCALWLAAEGAAKRLANYQQQRGRPPDHAKRALAAHCALIWSTHVRAPLGRPYAWRASEVSNRYAPRWHFAAFLAAVFQSARIRGTGQKYARELASDFAQKAMTPNSA